MAIYIQTGKSNSQDSIINGKYAFFDRSNNIKRSNNWIFNGEYIIIPGEGMVFEPKYYYGKFDLHQRCYAIKPNNENLLCKYLYYFCFINKKNFYLFSTGTTVPSLRLSSFSWVKKKKWIPIKQQQKIIDIIEPKKHLFEKYSNCIRIDSFENTQKDLQKIIDIIEPINYLKNNIKSIENKINFLVKNQSFKGFKEMYKFVKFNKGSIVKSTEFIYKNDQSNLIPFIDIKSLTGIVNKYLDNRKYKSNTQIGDVLLSLDGAPGRVSITNNGYNGYAYKINSNTISNAIIWASLINKINQKIIKKHSYGTTILHANTSKQLLLILNFKNVELIKILYQIKLLIFKIQQLIKNIYNLMLQLLIK